MRNENPRKSTGKVLEKSRYLGRKGSSNKLCGAPEGISI